MGHTPSKVLGVQRLANDILKMPDRITAISFDTAVMTWGIFCENMMSEREEDGTQPWPLERLLGEPEDIDNEASFNALVAAMGGMSI